MKKKTKQSWIFYFLFPLFHFFTISVDIFRVFFCPFQAKRFALGDTQMVILYSVVSAAG